MPVPVLCYPLPLLGNLCDLLKQGTDLEVDVTETKIGGVRLKGAFVFLGQFCALVM